LLDAVKCVGSQDLLIDILDEDIVLQRRPGSDRSEEDISFVYEPFMEYVVARGLANGRRFDVTGTMDMCKGFSNAAGVLEFLSSMLGEAGQEELWREVARGSADVQVALCRGIERIGDGNAVSHRYVLERIAQEGEAEARSMVARFVGLKLHTEFGADLLGTMLSSKEPHVIQAIGCAMSALPKDLCRCRLGQRLQAFLADGAGWHLALAARMAAVLGDEVAFPYLRTATKNDLREVRHAALVGLAGLQSKRAQRLLLRHMGSFRRGRRLEAYTALMVPDAWTVSDDRECWWRTLFQDARARTALPCGSVFATSGMPSLSAKDLRRHLRRALLASHQHSPEGTDECQKEDEQER
jgi:hypothetical protein